MSETNEKPAAEPIAAAADTPAAAERLGGECADAGTGFESAADAPAGRDQFGDGPSAPIRPLGGTYGKLVASYGGSLKSSGKEIHHIPSCDSTGIPERDGLAIVMDRADHRQVNSTGASDTAGCWRRDAEIMWEEGRKREVVDTEIAEIQTRFDGKYDEHLRQMLETAERYETEIYEVPRTLTEYAGPSRRDEQ